jgi:hypothetical protein
MSGLAVGWYSVLQHLDCSVQERNTKSGREDSGPGALLEQDVVARVSLIGKAEQYQRDSGDVRNLVALDNRQLGDVRNQQKSEPGAWQRLEAKLDVEEQRVEAIASDQSVEV